MKTTEIDREVRRLKELPVRLLREEYELLWGEPTRSNNKAFLVKRIVWRRQATERGGLSDEARQRALALAQDVELRVRPEKEIHRAYARAAASPEPAESGRSGLLPAVGTTLVREYRGRRIEVRVTQRGFEWEGDEYRSLTAVAEAVTGSAWNGRLFFGLSTRKV